MNAFRKIDMAQVTRLTREGRLKEAMAVLRGALNIGPAPTGTPERGFDPDPVSSRQETPVLDRPSASKAPPADDALSPHGDRAGRSFVSPTDLLGKFARRDLLHGLGNLSIPAARRTAPPLPDGARFDERVYANEAGSRTYKIYAPGNHSGRSLPLVVMLHGCTQSPDDFATGTRMNELAEEHGLLVAYPAQAQSANASRCWNWFSKADQQRESGEPSLIAGITRQIIDDFAVESGRVYVAGLSAGGAAAAIMASTYPDIYAAVGVHSGLACGAASDMGSALTAMRHGAAGGLRRSATSRIVPTIVFHGDRDKTVNPVNGDQVIAQSGTASDLHATISRGEAAGGISYTRTVHADGKGRSVIEKWDLHGVGHAWSGGSAAGSYTEPRGPDASREMVRFFLQY